MQLFGRFRCCKEAPVNSGKRMPRSPAMPQHGMPEGSTYAKGRWNLERQFVYR